jgi:hypothetical protein
MLNNIPGMIVCLWLAGFSILCILVLIIMIASKFDAENVKTTGPAGWIIVAFVFYLTWPLLPFTWKQDRARERRIKAFLETVK